MITSISGVVYALASILLFWGSIYWFTGRIEKWKADLKNGEDLNYLKLKIIGSKWLKKNSWVIEKMFLFRCSTMTRKWIFTKVLDLQLTKEFALNSSSLVCYESVFTDFWGYSPYARYTDVWYSISRNINLGSIIFEIHTWAELLIWTEPNVYMKMPENMISDCMNYVDFTWKKVALYTKLDVTTFINNHKIACELIPYFSQICSNKNIPPYEISRITKLAIFAIYRKPKETKVGVVETLPEGYVKITEEIFKVGEILWIKCEGGFCKDGSV